MTDFSDQIDKLKGLVEKSEKILVTSHISPDPDSICSTLLLGTTLRTNYPDKIIVTSSEELPEGLDFLAGYDRLQKVPLLDTVGGADLIIIVDTMNFARCSRNDFEKVTEIVKSKNIPVAIIDHHEVVGVDNNEVYINRKYPAAVEEVYEVLFTDLKLKKPEGWAQTTMAGLYSDTGGFTYLNEKYEETLKLVAELIKNGVSVERTRSKLNQYSLEHLMVAEELFKNIGNENGYTYSFLSDEFVDEWLKSGKSPTSMHVGTKIFTDQYLRNIDGNQWGFIAYRDPLMEGKQYSASFRSINGSKDVAALANKLNGGGHKGAAGAKIKTDSVQEALNKVKEAIKSSNL